MPSRTTLSTRELRRLARRGGVKEISDVRTVRRLAGNAMRSYVTDLVRDVLRYTDVAHRGSNTVTATDIAYTLSLR